MRTVKKIYISHAFGGKEENAQRVTNIINYLYDTIYLSDVVLLSPIHIFRRIYNVVDYEVGLQACLDLLETCDEMWVFDDYSESVGVKKEIEFCKEKGIPYHIFQSDDWECNSSYVQDVLDAHTKSDEQGKSESTKNEVNWVNELFKWDIPNYNTWR